MSQNKQHMKRLICILSTLGVCLGLAAQPPMRRAQQTPKEQGSAPELSVRAQTQYPGQVTMPDELIWKREIYRTLDLKQEQNSALYFPVEPIGTRMNLFTYVFKLLAEGKIKAYEYRLDGTEVLTPENQLRFQDLLDRFHIYYEEVVNRRDTVLRVDNSDIPSAEVWSYFIKEDWYFDQRSSTLRAQVTAICPVLHRAGDFSMDVVKSPMFWLNYADLIPYLSQMPVMTSDLNNTAHLTMNDYFVSQLYKGDIYKTTNRLNRTLNQYCTTDSALVKEQKRIEDQLRDFDENLWESTREAKRLAAQAKADSLAALADTVGVEKTAGPTTRTKTTTVVRNSKKKGSAQKEAKAQAPAKAAEKREKEKTAPKQKAASGPKVSVRRERR